MSLSRVSDDLQVAIKKIKVGEMKDGLDMTALREVKFLQELHHPNIIGVGCLDPIASESILDSSWMSFLSRGISTSSWNTWIPILKQSSATRSSSSNKLISRAGWL